MSAYMATGQAFTRELSLLQRNAAASPDGIVGALTRRLSSDTSQLSAVLEYHGGGASNLPVTPSRIPGAGRNSMGH